MKTFGGADNQTKTWNETISATLSGLTIPAKIDDTTLTGTYYIKVMSRPHGESNWQECYDGNAYKLTVTIAGNELTIDVPIPANVLPASVEFSDVSGDRKTGHEHTVTATITGGAGKYNGNIFLRVNNKAVMGTVLNIGAGETQVLQLSFNPLEAGASTIALYAGSTKIGTEKSIGVVAFTLDNEKDNTSIIKANHGKTTDATLYGRTLYKDGAWNTLCLPFEVTIAGSPLDGDGVTAMVFDGEHSGLDGTTLTLNFSEATTISAGTPFIIKWNNTGVNITDPVFSSVTIDNSAEAIARKTIKSADKKVVFKGLYFSYKFEVDDIRFLLVGNGNTLFWPLAGARLGSQRAYFQVAEEGQKAPAIHSINFTFDEESTGISSLTPDPSPKGEGSDYWYSIDGRKLQGMPTQKGIYIVNGRKVVIK